MSGVLANLDAIRKRHAWLKAQTKAALDAEAEAAGKIGADHPRHAATFKRRTGALQDSTAYRIVRIAGGRLVRLQNPKKYAAAIDSGAKPHPIEARRASMLRFVVNGQTLFRRRVKHPGNKPYKFLYRAAFAAYRVLGPNLETALGRVARKF